MRKSLSQHSAFSWAFAGFLLLSLTLLCAHRPHEAFAEKSEHCVTCQASIQSKKIINVSVDLNSAYISQHEEFQLPLYVSQQLTLALKIPIRGPPLAS